MACENAVLAQATSDLHFRDLLVLLDASRIHAFMLVVLIRVYLHFHDLKPGEPRAENVSTPYLSLALPALHRRGSLLSRLRIIHV